MSDAEADLVGSQPLPGLVDGPEEPVNHEGAGRSAAATDTGNANSHAAPENGMQHLQSIPMEPDQSPCPPAGPHLARAVIPLPMLIVASGVIAFIRARRCGGRERLEQRLLFLLFGAFRSNTAAAQRVTRVPAR